jgi:hypothetical protein
MHGRTLMKTIKTIASVRKADSSLDTTLNPVELSSKEIVSWAKAFPRPGSGTGRHTPMWRQDATIGTVLGVVGRRPSRALPSRP